MEMRSGEHGGHATGPAALICWSCQLSPRTSRPWWPKTTL